MLRTTIAVSISAFALSGCGFFGEPNVGCNEDSTKELVKNILIQEIEKKLDDPRVKVAHSAVIEKLSVSVDNVRADSFDEKINKHACKADLSVSLPMIAVSAFSSTPMIKGIIAQEGMSITANGVQGPIQYTSQSADGGEKHYVEMMGHTPLAEAVSLAAIMGAFNVEVSAASAAAPAAPAAPAEEVAVSNARPDDYAESESAAVGPSFDCAKAGTQIEKLICATPAISALDLRMSEAYKQLLSASEDPASFKKEQSAWIKEKRNACKSAECLEAEYQSRTDDLEATLQYLSKPAEFR